MSISDNILEVDDEYFDFDLEDLDVLVMLSGSDECIETGVKVWNKMAERISKRVKKYQTPLPIITTGHTPIYEKTRARPESLAVREQLVLAGVDQDVICCEQESSDMLSALVYSWSIIESLRKFPYVEQEVGIVVGRKNMHNAYWLSKRLYGKKNIPTIFPAGEKPTRKEKWQNWKIKRAWKKDLRGIRRGNKRGFEDYLRTRHPYHARKVENRRMGSYDKIIATLGGVQRL